MVSRKGVTWFVIVLLAISTGWMAAPAVAAEPSPEHRVIPAPPEEEPETPASRNGHGLRVSDAVYRVESGDDEVSGDAEVQTELVRWHRGWGYGGWGHRGWGFGGWGRRGWGFGGWGGGFGYRRWGFGGWGGGFGYPRWGWGGRRWAFAPMYRPFYGGYYGYPAVGFGYGNAYPVYGNQFAYGYGSPYGFGGYGMSYPYNYGYFGY